MRKLSLFALFLLTLACTARSQYVADSTLLLPKSDMQWWRDAKFGLFIHFGLYAIPGRGEWVMWQDQIDTADYSKLRDQFTPTAAAARQWVKVASDAGCKYMVVTARHHDGFCLFETHCGDYDAVHSAAKTDLIRAYADAGHKAGMRVGLYYSPLDWRFPGFFFPSLYRSNAERMKQQTYTQVRELLTNYGKVDVLWYDGGEDNWLGFGGLQWDGARGWYTRGFEKPYTGKFSWEPLKLNKMVRELQPKIVISQRSGWMGDFDSHEVRFKGRPRDDRPWELCTLLGGTAWGWTPDAATQIMSLDSCIQLLVMTASQGGNLLVNVGPRADGSIEPAEVQRLKEIGTFLSRYGESIYATRGGVYDKQWGGTTVTDAAVYVHILHVPAGRTITVPSVSRKVASAAYMRDNTSASFAQSASGISLSGLPETNNEPDLIVKLTLSPP